MPELLCRDSALFSLPAKLRFAGNGVRGNYPLVSRNVLRNPRLILRSLGRKSRNPFYLLSLVLEEELDESFAVLAVVDESFLESVLALASFLPGSLDLPESPLAGLPDFA